MPLISSESNLILIYTKLYVPMVTLLTNDNAKLLQ